MDLYGLILWLCLTLSMQYSKGNESYFYYAFKTKIINNSCFMKNIFLEPVVALDNHIN